MSPLRVESLFPRVLCFEHEPCGVKSQMPWGFISPAQGPGQGCLVWSTNLLLRKEKIHLYIHSFLCFLRSLPIVGRHIRGGVSGKCVFLPVLQISTWPFYPLLWNRCSASSQVLFRGYCSMCGCICAVSVGGGKFRIFLCHQS